MWINSLPLPPTEMVTIAACALLGAFFLSRYTAFAGILNYAVNLAILFGGGLAANLIEERFISSPQMHSYEKTLIATFVGMLVSALAAILFFGNGVSD